MFSDDHQALSQPISVRLFAADLQWLDNLNIERSEFLRNLAHARVTHLKRAALCSTDRSVPIMNIFSKGDTKPKSEAAAPPSPLRASIQVHEPMSHGDIESRAAWSDDTAYVF